MVATLTGTRVITAADIASPLAALKSDLESANVASNIATSITQSVATSLVGRTLTGYSVNGMIRTALATAIERVLTPSVKIDVLRDVIAKREVRTCETIQPSLCSLMWVVCDLHYAPPSLGQARRT